VDSLFICRIITDSVISFSFFFSPRTLLVFRGCTIVCTNIYDSPKVLKLNQLNFFSLTDMDILSLIVPYNPKEDYAYLHRNLLIA
jgi:hypothetical protein